MEAFEIRLFGTNLGVKAHRTLIDGDSVAALNGVNFYCRSVNLSAYIHKLLFCSEDTDKIIARTERNSGKLNVIVAINRIDDIIYRSVTATSIYSCFLAALTYLLQ